MTFFYKAKDFVETAEGLLFAVVTEVEEQGRVLCCLRYMRQAGRWQKLSSQQANLYLGQHHPQYLFHAHTLDADVHGVMREQVVRHLCPRQVLKQRLAEAPIDDVVADLQALCGFFAVNGLPLQAFGITGSLLLGAQGAASDIDLVCYQREVFHQARYWVQALIAQNKLQTLDDADWLEAFRRRGCDFPFDDYVWHEKRKYNKGLIHGRKFDLSLVAPSDVGRVGSARKLGITHLQARITEDVFGFDYPARWSIDEPGIDEVLCFTATYTGQAQTGEQVAIAGQLEVDDSGCRRIIVGSDREAIGEYIRVLR